MAKAELGFLDWGKSVDDKLKHLDYIQAAIVRMASNSFLLKRWCIVVVASVAYFALRSDCLLLAMMALALPIFLFACFDLYFLRLERLFRWLYDDVRKKKEGDTIDFSMDIKPFQCKETWNRVARRPIFWGFHGGLAIVWMAGLAIAFSAPDAC